MIGASLSTTTGVVLYHVPQLQAQSNIPTNLSTWNAIPSVILSSLCIPGSLPYTRPLLSSSSVRRGGRLISAPSSLPPSQPKKRRALREIDIERNQHDESNKLSFQTCNIPVGCNNEKVVAAVLLSKVCPWRKV